MHTVSTRSLPPWRLPGVAAVIILAALLAEAGLCQLTGTPVAPACLGLTLVPDAVLVGFSIYTVAFLAYIVFATEGRMHPQLSLWRIVDVILAHLIGQSVLTFAVWKLGAVRGKFDVYSHTGNVGAFYAAYDLLIYTFYMFSGGGIIDNAPLAEMARFIIAVQLAWNSIAIIIILAAAVATLAEHTDAFTTKQ